MKKILIVEDEAVIALGLKRILTKMGYDVIGITYSGEEALETARSTRPDLILMDIMIPDKLDGISVDLVILDLILPDKSGFEIISQILDMRLKE